MPPKGYLKRLREICDAHGILLVFDEVICGFGRTGPDLRRAELRRHARPHDDGEGHSPTARSRWARSRSSERIHDTIMAAAPEGAIEFFHGYTYSGHPAACAAGLATLDIYKNEGLFERGRELSPYFLDALFSLKDMPVVADIRGYAFDNQAAQAVTDARRSQAGEYLMSAIENSRDNCIL